MSRMDWLLCDFHIHTKFSDGRLSLREVVDLFGKHGFDVISITDHILDRYTLEERIRKGEQINAITKEEIVKEVKEQDAIVIVAHPDRKKEDKEMNVEAIKDAIRKNENVAIYLLRRSR